MIKEIENETQDEFIALGLNYLVGRITFKDKDLSYNM